MHACTTPLNIGTFVQVEMADFERALAEVKPAFGVTTETLEQHRLNGIIDSGQQFRDLSTTLRNLVAQVHTTSLRQSEQNSIIKHCHVLPLMPIQSCTGLAG